MEHGDIKVEVEDDQIVVSTGHVLSDRFFQASAEPRLVQSPVMSVEKEAPAQSRESEALAWEAANTKAWELGWIV